MNVEKHSQVHKWLVEIFGPNGVPEFEICERTIDVLHSIMKHDQECDDDREMMMGDAKTKSIQYETEAKRIEDILKAINMTPSSLPPDVFGKLKALVNIIQQLEIQQVDTASLSLGIFKMLKEGTATEIDLKRAQFEMDKLAKKVSSCSLVSEQLGKSLMHARMEVEVEEEKSNGNQEMVDLSTKKIKEYEEKSEHYENVLSKSGFSTSLTHEALMKKYEHLNALRDEFKELKTKLDSYHDLPTDLTLLGKKLSEAKVHLNDLEESLTIHYQSM